MENAKTWRGLRVLSAVGYQMPENSKCLRLGYGQS